MVQMVTRRIKETYVTALFYDPELKSTVEHRFYVPGWYPDPGGRRLIKAIKNLHIRSADVTLVKVESCRCGYCVYQMPLFDFIKRAAEHHETAETKEHNDHND